MTGMMRTGTYIQDVWCIHEPHSLTGPSIRMDVQYLQSKTSGDRISSITVRGEQDRHDAGRPLRGKTAKKKTSPQLLVQASRLASTSTSTHPETHSFRGCPLLRLHHRGIPGRQSTPHRPRTGRVTMRGNGSNISRLSLPEAHLQTAAFRLPRASLDHREGPRWCRIPMQECAGRGCERPNFGACLVAETAWWWQVGSKEVSVRTLSRDLVKLGW